MSLSSCLLVLAAGPDVQARSRVIQGVATGVGFLGAGEILVPARPKRVVPEVHGLTSAASIWFTAVLGITFATSTPLLAGVALALALITLSGPMAGLNGPGPGSHGASAAGDPGPEEQPASVDDQSR
ncbi:MAG: MgtC/SapB family protein [Cyanobacteriota bacterium]